MTLFRNDRCNAEMYLFDQGRIPKRGGGVAIYVKNCWVPYVSLFKEGTKITENFEVISLIVDKPSFRKLLICATYKPPTGKIDKCLQFLEYLCNENMLKNREKWLLGDFNLNLENRNAPDVLLANRFFKDNGLKQLITTHTRLTNRGGSCIDWILTDCPYVSHSGTLDDLVSDHFTIFSIRKKAREIITKKWKSIRIYKNFDKVAFTALLCNNDWNLYYTVDDVDILWQTIYSRIIEILAVMCPYKNVCLRDPKTPWITPEIIKIFNERRKYLRMFRKTRNKHIWEICKYLRNKCNTLVKNAKSSFIKERLLNTADDPRKFWKSINNILKGPKTEHIAHEFVDNVTGRIIQQDMVVDFLNEYYANIGMANMVGENRRPDWTENDPGYYFDEVTLKEVVTLVKEIDIGKDCCIEGISTSILKQGFSVITKQLQYLFNTSLNKAMFPRDWAKGFINILPKGGNLKDPSNWRPITQTLLPAKMLEKLVQKRIYNILCRTNYISDNQYGFMPGRSTQYAIFEILRDIYEARNSKLITGMVFLDVRKAFDSLDHNILLTKLQALGLSGMMLNWFSSYLDRTQRVRHNGYSSNELKFRCGIPQGSCLGPTLFIFYINAVFDNVDNNVKMMMFADDCVLYKSHQESDIVLNNLQTGLNDYVQWGIENNMHLNVSKTKAMLLFPTVDYNLHRPLYASGIEVHYVRTFNYLGVVIDDQLCFTTYYHLVKRRVENKIFVLSKIRKHVDNRTALLIYKQAVLPLLEYAGFVLASCTVRQRSDLQILQNNALRLSKRYYLRDHVQIVNLHTECHVLGLEQRRRKQLLRLMYLYSKKESNIQIPIRVTRARTKIVFKVATKCTGKYLGSPFYKGTLLWNTLSVDLQRMQNVYKFVEGLKYMYNGYQEIW